jgi:alpha-beta hydrolase superfamily lysophospholipase
VVLAAALVVVTCACSVRAAPTRAADCPEARGIVVPGAERQDVACVSDLTTAGTTATGHTNPLEWTALQARGTRNPSGVPGVQVDGHFADDSSTNANHGWRHDAQFVLRLPERWNGKLVVTGAPGVLGQYASDFIFSDWLVDRGYAFAATDKGSTGPYFFRDGAEPGDAMVEWHSRLGELTRAAKQAVARRYGSEPRRTYVTGYSNGGYLVRTALEREPSLYDGGVEWAAPLWRVDGPNPLTFLPIALRAYPRTRLGDRAARKEMVDAGFPARSEFLWSQYHAAFWDVTQRTFREELDPGYDGALQAGIPLCLSGVPRCDADYPYADRPALVPTAVGRVENTGRIGRPLLSLHGTLDALLPPRLQGEAYARLVRAAGREALHRSYAVEDGTHLDALHDLHPDRVRPILPCHRRAFRQLEAWVERDVAPPPSGTIPRGGGDVVNACP